MLNHLSKIAFVSVINPSKKHVILEALLGQNRGRCNIEFMTTAGKYIYQMYNTILKSRNGIG